MEARDGKTDQQKRLKIKVDVRYGRSQVRIGTFRGGE